MFKYFPTNYVWNLSVDLSIEMGARIGEIEEMCAPLQEAAKAPDAAGTIAFRQSWVAMADKLIGLAEEDEAHGRSISAGDKQVRAELSSRHGRSYQNSHIRGKSRQDQRNLFGQPGLEGRTQPIHSRTSSDCSWPRLSARDRVSSYCDSDG